MNNKINYEECYCPENLDADFPQNWRRKNYVIPFAEGKKPSYPSDSDLITIISKKLIADFNLNNHDIGVYLRLSLLEYFGYSWRTIYDFGEEENIYQSLKNLYENGYINLTKNNEIKTRGI